MLTSQATLAALLLAVAASTASAQAYWSTNPNLDCGGYPHVLSQPIWVLGQGVQGPGPACEKLGDIPWFVAGQGWLSYIRVSAPSSGAIKVFVPFDGSSGLRTLNFGFSGDPAIYWDYTVSRVLAANQSTEIVILGFGTQYQSSPVAATGRLLVQITCPDAFTCSQVQVQLIYSALPARPWVFSVAAVWFDQLSTQWSTVGIDDGGTDQVSFAVSNESNDLRLMHRNYTVNVYDSSGSLYSTGKTPQVEGGNSYGGLLRDVVPNLPPGPFKLQLVADSPTAFAAFQFHGASATALVVASEKKATPATTNAAPPRGTRY